MKKYTIISLFVLTASVVSCKAGGGDLRIEKIKEINLVTEICGPWFSPCGKYLFVMDFEDKGTLINLKTMKSVSIDDQACITALNDVWNAWFSPCDRFLIVINKGFTGALINLKTMNIIKTIENMVKAHFFTICSECSQGKLPSLKCLASQTIAKKNVPYQTKVPKECKYFINRHKLYLSTISRDGTITQWDIINA